MKSIRLIRKPAGGVVITTMNDATTGQESDEIDPARWIDTTYINEAKDQA